jgi:hypothetical protein
MGRNQQEDSLHWFDKSVRFSDSSLQDLIDILPESLYL